MLTTWHSILFRGKRDLVLKVHEDSYRVRSFHCNSTPRARHHASVLCLHRRRLKPSSFPATNATKDVTKGHTWTYYKMQNHISLYLSSAPTKTFADIISHGIESEVGPWSKFCIDWLSELPNANWKQTVTNILRCMLLPFQSILVWIRLSFLSGFRVDGGPQTSNSKSALTCWVK